MDWEKFMLHARKDGLLLPTVSTYEYGRGDMLLVPLKTPKDPRNIYQLVKLIGAYAYPAKRAVSVRQLLERLARRTDASDPNVTTITWHHPWRLPDNVNPDECVALGEYLTTNGYAQP